MFDFPDSIVYFSTNWKYTRSIARFVLTKHVILIHLAKVWIWDAQSLHIVERDLETTVELTMVEKNVWFSTFALKNLCWYDCHGLEK